MKYDLYSLLFDLCSSVGVSGCEDDAAEKAAKYLSRFADVSRDALGNVVGRIGGDAPCILLDAHIDRIGLTVTSVDANGFVKAVKRGGVDARTVSAGEVTIWGSRKVFGVISSIPPHLSKGDDASKAPDLSEICIDTGLGEEAQRLISAGDTVTFNGAQRRLLENKAVSPCVDDRAGVAAVLRCLEILEESGKETCALTVSFSVQEETGGSGAKTAGFASSANEAIAVDVGFANAPGVKDEESGKLGGGAMIGFAATLDNAMSKKLVSIAKEKDIKWQSDVMGGSTSTNSDSIQTCAGGIKCALLSIPIRNMHTAVETVCVDDIEAVAQLMAAYILERSEGNA